MRILIVWLLSVLLILTLFWWLILYHGSGHIIPIKTDSAATARLHLVVNVNKNYNLPHERFVRQHGIEKIPSNGTKLCIFG